MPTSEYQAAEAIKGLYPDSRAWQGKVDRMKPAQVLAIYLKFKARGILKES
jgi:hypothetical protein